MKKTLSLLLAAGLALSQCGSALAEDPAESALIAVKEKISVPAELSEFETEKNDYNGEITYSFRWSDEDGSQTITVDADADGHITGYYRYSDDWYKDESRFVIDPGFDITELEAYAAAELEKMAPELFENDTDRLTAVPYNGSLSLDERSRYSFTFVREYNGVEVKDNNAAITVLNTKDGYVVSDANISWDYKTQFAPPESVIGTEAAQAALAEKFAPQLAYRKSYGDDEKYFLEYTFGETKYISAESAEEIEEDPKTSYVPYQEKTENSAAMDSGSSGGGSSRVTLTPEEIAELENIAGLKSLDELLNTLYSMPELGVSAPADSSAVSSNTFKVDDGYRVSVSITEKSEDSEYPESSVYASFDAQTGELLSFSRYGRDIYLSSETDKTLSREKARDFLDKYFSDKTATAKLDEESDSAYFVRLVNDIPYSDNYIYASWDEENGYISSFGAEWDGDISAIPAPGGIISSDDAAAAAFAKYPAKTIYIISDGAYRQVYTFSCAGIRIDAFSGKIVDYNGEEITDAHSGSYADTDGHWVASIASELAKYGIVIEGEMLRPDEEITQSEFLKLIYSGILGYPAPADSEQVYRRLIGQQVLSDEEINSQAPITRENAIRYLLRAMGIREVAEISGIYICDFADSADISADKFGYCAIAKGFGIVSGSDGYLYPQSNITRAEALTMIYNYLTR